MLAALPAIAMALEQTTTLRVGCRVFCNDYHHPVMLAKEAATMDYLSDGRLEFGIGAGWIKAEYEASLRGLYASAKGCLGAHLLWDQDKGEAVSLTLWASAEHLSALTETDEYASRMRAFGAHLAGVPEVRTVQVLASVPACPPTGADSGPAPGATGPAQRRA